MESADPAVEELEALSAIYGDDCEVNTQHRTVQVYLPSRDAFPRLLLSACLPDSYPLSTPPVLQLQAPYLSDDLADWATTEIDRIFVPGEVVMYTYIEWLKEQPSLYSSGASASCDVQPDQDVSTAAGGEWGEEEDEEDGGLAAVEECRDPAGRSRAGQNSSRYDPEEEAAVDAMAAKITSGPPFTERKSTFQAHVAPVSSHAEVKAVVAALMRVNKVANATHNIMAYRIHVRDKNTFLQDYDDDGEAAAGGRLLHLLQLADARNVVVVVSRWFGGVLLGPVRFALINNTARQLLEEQGHVSQRGEKKGGGKGKK